MAVGIPTFLTDQSHYDFIRNLWAQGRVFAIRGDLTADVTMLDLAYAIERSGLTLEALCISTRWGGQAEADLSGVSRLKHAALQSYTWNSKQVRRAACLQHSSLS